MNSLGQIYKHIESMRHCDKPYSYDEIKTFLTEQGFDEAKIKHAISYTREKERQENYLLKGKGDSVEHISGILGGIAILIGGIISLGLMIYFSVKMIEVWSLSPERQAQLA